MSPAPPLTSPHLLAAVRKWLSVHRLDGNLRLPPERELAAKFCVSRAELRKVLSTLEEEGQIQRYVGRGTFIVENATQSELVSEDIAARTSPLAAMQARGIIEPELCRLAALNATSAQINEMRSLCRQMENAAIWEEYAELDWRFHNTIAEATGNVLLVEIQSLLNGVRRYVVWGNLLKRPVGPEKDYHSFREHAAIVDAIEARDPERAVQAMSIHLGGTQVQIQGVRGEPAVRGVA